MPQHSGLHGSPAYPGGPRPFEGLVIPVRVTYCERLVHGRRAIPSSTALRGRSALFLGFGLLLAVLLLFLFEILPLILTVKSAVPYRGGIDLEAFRS